MSYLLQQARAKTKLLTNLDMSLNITNMADFLLRWCCRNIFFARHSFAGFSC